MTGTVETALRWLATRKHARPYDLLLRAIDAPRSESAQRLAPLVTPTESVPDQNPESRAQAAWGLIVSTVGKVGTSNESRRRNALLAAFRVSRAEITEPWKSTLEDRFGQLRALPGVFGDRPSTTAAMHKAWRQALAELVPLLQDQLDALAADGERWQPYVELGRAVERAGDQQPSDPAEGYKRPSTAAFSTRSVNVASHVSTTVCRCAGSKIDRDRIRRTPGKERGSVVMFHGGGSSEN